jgi:hypothetical protein
LTAYRRQEALERLAQGESQSTICPDLQRRPHDNLAAGTIGRQRVAVAAREVVLLGATILPAHLGKP